VFKQVQMKFIVIENIKSNFSGNSQLLAQVMTTIENMKKRDKWYLATV